MSRRDENTRRETVIRHVCGREVPRSAALTAAGRDYTFFFCGRGCYQRWSANQGVDREGR